MENTEFILSALVTVIGGIIGAITTFLKSFKFVQEGSLGLKLRFGKVIRNKKGQPKVINPGFVWLIPWVDTLVRRHVRQQTIRLQNQRIILSDDLVYVLSAIVLFRVNNIYRALFEIDGLDGALVDFCQGILRDVASLKNYKDIGDSEEISGELLEKIKSQGEVWGVEFLAFKLVDNAPSAETTSIVNIEVGSRMKMKALMNAAEGFKVPLESLNSGLGAVLTGVPLVANVSSPVRVTATQSDGDGEEGASFSFKIGAK